VSETSNICVKCGKAFHATYSERDKDWKHWKAVAEAANVCTECQSNHVLNLDGSHAVAVCWCNPWRSKARPGSGK
jgi:hypothetical protein